MESTDSGQLLVRVDANSQIGIGHFMRCLSLGQGWAESGGSVTFATDCKDVHLLDRLRWEGFGIHPVEGSHPAPEDWESLHNLLELYPEACVTLDGYHLDTTYQELVRGSGNRVLVIDDMGHLDRYVADIILNQNVHATSLKYNCEPGTKLLLGTQYTLLRREFRSMAPPRRRAIPVARRLLVTLGGTDPHCVTSRVLEALESVQCDDLEVSVIIGEESAVDVELAHQISLSSHEVRLLQHVPSMAEEMAKADLAITGAGTTCWETAYMGLPSIVIVLADNQRMVAQFLERKGVIVNLGWHEDIRTEAMAEAISTLVLSSETRSKMARMGQKLVDGDGVHRVVMHLMNSPLRLTRVRNEDRRLLWEWANDPEVRSSAFSTGPIAWEEHVDWFRSKMRESGCLLLLALDAEDTPVGQVRFDSINESETEIDISIDRSRRGRGYGSLLIDKAVERVLRTTQVRVIHAFIKPENVQSVRAFERAGFVRAGIESKDGMAALHYVRGDGNES